MFTARQPTGLMVDLLSHPESASIRNRTPTFSWIVNDAAPNAHQFGFQLLVSSDPERLNRDEGDVWDSGAPDIGGAWQTDARSIAVPYGGNELAPETEYHWKVRTWNGVGNLSPWSEPARFRIGTFSDEHMTDCAPVMATEVAPVCVVRTAPGTWFVDFGRAAFGTVLITTSAPEKRTLRIALGEVSTGADAVEADPGGSRRYREIEVAIPEGDHTRQVEIKPDPRNTGDFAILMPDELFEVTPFRYCEVSGYPGTLTRERIRQIAVHYPFDDGAARFTSSSKVLNDVWELCRYTMKATSFTGYYVDGDRERIPYEADSYINQLGHYACDREYAMARRTHEYLITSPTWPTEWILDSVLMAWEDYLYTGCDRSIRRYYDDLAAKSLIELARSDGLISTQQIPESVLEAIHFTGRSADQFSRGISDIVDWPQCERDGFDLRPINSVVNALHFRAVRLMERIADALERRDDAKWYRDRAGLIRRSFQAKLIDPDSGLVIDGEGSLHSSLHANLFALGAGLVPEASLAAVVRHLEAKGMACSVYASHFLLEALYDAGAADYALHLLTSTTERSWAHMIYDVGSTIALEAWDDRFKPNQDWNHAWGAAPASIIPRWLMGIRPAAPGFERITIDPQPGSLSWAEVTTPTIRGPVTVRLNHEPSRSFFLETETPANTTADVTVPALGSSDPTVVVDGLRVVGRMGPRGVTISGIGSGRHTLVRSA